MTDTLLYKLDVQLGRSSTAQPTVAACSIPMSSPELDPADQPRRKRVRFAESPNVVVFHPEENVPGASPSTAPVTEQQ